MSWTIKCLMLYNPLRSKIYNFKRIHVTSLTQSNQLFDETTQKTILCVTQNSQFTEITQNLIREELQRSSSLDIHDIYSTGRSK